MGLQHLFNKYSLNDWVIGNMLGTEDTAIKKTKTSQLALSECLLCALEYAIEILLQSSSYRQGNTSTE